jgi:hypothetical protein
MSVENRGPGDKRKVLLLAYYYLPAITSGVQRAVRFAKYLPDYGFPTRVVTSLWGGTSDLAGVSYVPNAKTHAAVGRATDWLMAAVQQMLPYREQLEWAPHAIASSTRLILDDGICAVISTSPPAATHFAAFYLKLRFGLKWIADFRDPLLGNPGRARRWAKPYDHLLEQCIFGYADRILGVTDTMVDSWQRKHPRWREKFHVLWNGYDPAEEISSIAIPIRPCRTLSHVGVLYSQRHPYRILSALDRLISEGRLNPAELRLRFLGQILEEERFRSHPAVVSLQSKHCLEITGTAVPREMALAETANSDYLLLLDIDNLENLGYTVPAKLFDYLRTGRPVMAATSRHSPVDRILPESGIPYCCIYHSDEDREIEEKALGFLHLPSTPHTPSSWFLNTFNGKRQAEMVAAMIDALLGN